MSRHQWLFGIHAVAAGLAHHPDRIEGLWLEHKRRGPRIQALLERAEHHRIPVYRESRDWLERKTATERHQGVVAKLVMAEAAILSENALIPLLEGLSSPPLLLILDGVQDPHNLGACLRSADAAGVHGVIVPTDRAVGLTPTVRKVACGGAENMPLFQVTNLARTLRWLKDQGLWIIGAAGEAEQTLYDLDLRGSLAIVMGAEDKGLRRLTRENCDYLARIPMAGCVESLNVSVAAGILLFEAVRQRAQGRS